MLITFGVLDETNTVVNTIVIDSTYCPPRPINKTAKQHMRELAKQITGNVCIEIPWTYKEIDVTGPPIVGIGSKYDILNDKLIPPKPYPSWIWNDAVDCWLAPVPYPEYYGQDAVYMKRLPYMADPDPKKLYFWDETSQQWFLPKRDFYGNAYTDENARIIGENGFVSDIVIAAVNLPPAE